MNRSGSTLTRAERIRQRRLRQQQRSRQEGADTRRRLHKPRRARPRRGIPAAPPRAERPVMVGRYAPLGQAVVPPQGATRPQVRLPLRPGAEVVATLPRLRLGWHWLSGALALFAFLVVWALWTWPMFRVQEVKVVGAKRVDPQALRWLAGLGQPAIKINPSLLAASLQAAYPVLADVRVQVVFPNRVVVQVRERRPVLVWAFQGRRYWVDAEGVFFPAMQGKGPEVIVRAQGMPPGVQEPELTGQTLPVEMVAALQTLAQALPPGTPLAYHPAYGLGWVAPEGWQVYLGPRPTAVEARLTLYRALVEELARRGVRPSVVNLSSLNAPYVRMEP